MRPKRKLHISAHKITMIEKREVLNLPSKDVMKEVRGIGVLW